MSGVVAAGAVLFAGAAWANPRPLPFTYLYETSPKGGIEVEQYVDATIVPVEGADGKRVWEPGFLLQTEFEYGITDKLELGVYLQLENEPGGPLSFDGVKERLRYRLAEAGDWPVDVALYLELAEFHDELELEAKVILQRQLGPLRLAVNLWAETEFAFDGEVEFILNPTAGITWQLHPAFSLGLEYWMHMVIPAVAEDGWPSFNDAPHHFVGPAALVQFDKFWWSLGAYVRLDGMDRPAEPGDAFGRVYFRTVLGLSL